MRQDHQNYGSWFIHTEIVKAVKVDFSNPTEAFHFCKGKLRREGKKFFSLITKEFLKSTMATTLFNLQKDIDLK